MLDLPFIIAPDKDVREEYPSDLPPEEVPVFLSRLKAQAYLDDLKDDDILITADTVVLLENDILSKPSDKNEAKLMLRKMSDKLHRVVTGVSLSSTKKSVSFSTVTEVKFSTLSEADIEYYVEKYNPLDKAGAYGIQEWIGAVGIASINGSFYNVMGLPVHRLYKELISF